MVLPTSLKHAVVNCGMNNLNQDSPQDIASKVVLVGLALKKKCPPINIIITGIILKGLKWSRIRSKISKTNLILKKLSKINELFYMDNNFGWTLENGDLKDDLYYSDYIHLKERGNDKFAISIIKALKSSETIPLP